MSLAVARSRAFHVRAILVALLVALGGIGLGVALSDQTEAHLERLTSLELAAVESDITAHLSARVDALVRMAGRHRQRPTPEAWREDAHYFIPHFPSFELIAWMDGAGSVRRATMSASSDDAALPPLDVERARAICERVRGQGSPVIGPAWPAEADRWLGLIGVPAPTDLDPDGVLIALVRLDDLLARAVSEAAVAGFGVCVTDGERPLFACGAPKNGGPVAVASLERHGPPWTLHVWPLAQTRMEQTSLLPAVAVAGGLLVAGLVGGVLGLAGTLRLRARELELAGVELRAQVAERRRAEAELDERAKELARSNASLEQFAYVASHDLQEPLRMVASFTELLARRYEGRLDEEADEYIGFAVDGARRMQGLIDDLLRFARVDARGKPFEPVESAEVLDRVLGDMAVTLEETGAVVTHDPLPRVVADRGQLGQLFQNLIGNAVKFHGEAPPRVHVSATARPGEWVFSVRDEGIGIDPRFSERIFEVFKRLHPRSKFGGTGMGLAICRRIIERHRGRIWVESAPDAGATFFFAIPSDLPAGENEQQDA